MAKVMNLGTNKDTAKAVKAVLGATKPAKLQLNIHPDMHKLFKSVSVDKGQGMGELVLEAVAEYLRANGKEVNPVWMKSPKEWD